MDKKMHGFTIENMSFAFAGGMPFFTDISCTFRSGAIHGIVGKNGTGKSTLFRILQRRIGPGEHIRGVLSVNGQMLNLADPSIQRQCGRHIKAVVQNISEMVVPTCTVMENLQLANMSQFPVLKELPKAQDVGEILHKARIDPHAYVRQLSGGQRQILAILMMLQQSARVLLLDEPTSALDAQNARMVMDCVNELARIKDLVIVIISHDQELVKACVTGSLFEIQQYENGQRVLRQVQNS